MFTNKVQQEREQIIIQFGTSANHSANHINQHIMCEIIQPAHPFLLNGFCHLPSTLNLLTLLFYPWFRVIFWARSPQQRQHAKICSLFDIQLRCNGELVKYTKEVKQKIQRWEWALMRHSHYISQLHLYGCCFLFTDCLSHQ